MASRIWSWLSGSERPTAAASPNELAAAIEFVRLLARMLAETEFTGHRQLELWRDVAEARLWLSMAVRAQRQAAAGAEPAVHSEAWPQQTPSSSKETASR